MVRLERLSRSRAAAIHLALSCVIALATMIVMLALWYPPPLFGAMGGKELVALIVGIDVAIGPLITLIVFNPRKKKLRFDLSVIAVLQLSALAYGVYAMHEGRPAYIVFVEDRFVVVSAAEIEDAALVRARPKYRKLPRTGPVVVAADLPDNPKERVTLFFVGLAGLGVHNLPYLFVPYDERTAKVLGAARPLDRLATSQPADKLEVDRAVARLGRSPQSLCFLPVRVGHSTLTALIDANNGEVLVLVAANPAGPAAGGQPAPS